MSVWQAVLIAATCGSLGFAFGLFAGLEAQPDPEEKDAHLRARRRGTQPPSHPDVIQLHEWAECTARTIGGEA